MSGGPRIPEPSCRRSIQEVLERADLLQGFKPGRTAGQSGPLSHGRHLCIHVRLRPPLLAHIEAHPRRHPHLPLPLPACPVQAVEHLVRPSDRSHRCLWHRSTSQTCLTTVWIPRGGGGVSKRIPQEHSLQVERFDKYSVKCTFID